MKTILQIAEDEGFTEIEATSVQAYSCTREELERFAARIRAEQKEKDANICEEMLSYEEDDPCKSCAEAIRNIND